MSALETAYLGALNGDAALLVAAPGGALQDVAPDGTTAPYVLVTLLDAVDDYEMGGPRATTATYRVECWARALTAATTAATRIQAVLGGALTLAGYTVIDSYRIGHSSRRVLDETQKVWWVEGGTYRLQVE